MSGPTVQINSASYSLEAAKDVPGHNTSGEAINVTPSGTTARIAIYDFVDAPNPTSFKVLLFDTSGNRVSGDFSWQARGT